MKKINLILAITVLAAMIFMPTRVSADQASCVRDCIAQGNGTGECNAICSGNPNVNWDENFDPEAGLTQNTLDTLNPLKIAGSSLSDELSTPGGIISRLLAFIFPISGLILFVMLVWGGFEILVGAAEKKHYDAGKQRITAALVGFTLLFCTFWITQIIEVMFGVIIL